MERSGTETVSVPVILDLSIRIIILGVESVFGIESIERIESAECSPWICVTAS